MAAASGIERANAIGGGERPRAGRLGAAPALAVEPSGRVRGVELRPVPGGEGHVGEDARPVLVQSPRQDSGLSRGAGRRRDVTAASRSSGRPGRRRWRRRRRRRTARSCRHGPAHSSRSGRGSRCQLAPRTFGIAAFRPPRGRRRGTSFKPRRPRRASLRRKAVRTGTTADRPMSLPSPSRRPSAPTPTPTATIPATDTMRTFRRTFGPVASMRRRAIVAPSVRARWRVPVAFGRAARKGRRPLLDPGTEPGSPGSRRGRSSRAS